MLDYQRTQQVSASDLMLRAFVIVAVSRAYACLSDPEKRVLYNRHGSEDAQLSGRRGGGAGGFSQEGFDPDELFNMFFGNRGFGGQFGPRCHSQA